MVNTYLLINLLHIIIIAPLLLYIAYAGYYDEKISNVFYILLALIAIWAFVYHIYKLVYRA
jgi:hypothetical protein